MSHFNRASTGPNTLRRQLRGAARWALGAGLVAGVTVACGSDDDANGSGGTGGTGGSSASGGTGGSSASGGTGGSSASGGTGGASGGTGGSGASGGAAGSTTGGTAGAGGSAGSPSDGGGATGGTAGASGSGGTAGTGNDGGLLPATLGWIKRFGSTGADALVQMASDASGHLYVLAKLGGDVDFGNGVTATRPDGGASQYHVLLQLDSAGVAQWVVDLGTAVGVDVAVSGTGAVWVLGTGVPPQGSASEPNIFLSQYAAGGAHVLTRQMGGTATDQYPNRLAVAGNDVIAVGGVQCAGAGNFVFGTFTSPCASMLKGFVVKYDTAGTALWALVGQSAQANSAREVAVDAAGNVFFGGWMDSDVTWAGTAIAYNGSTGTQFLARLNGAGTTLTWGKPVSPSSPPSFAIGALGSSVVLDTWTHQGRTVLGQTAAAEGDSFVTVDPATGDGTALVKWGHTNGVTAGPTAFSASGSILRGSRFYGGGFGTQLFTPLSASGDAALARFDSSGQLQGLARGSMDAGSNFAVSDVAWGPSGAWYGGGHFAGTLGWSGTSVQSSSTNDADLWITQIAP